MLFQASPRVSVTSAMLLSSEGFQAHLGEQEGQAHPTGGLRVLSGGRLMPVTQLDLDPPCQGSQHTPAAAWGAKWHREGAGHRGSRPLHLLTCSEGLRRRGPAAMGTVGGEIVHGTL